MAFFFPPLLSQPLPVPPSFPSSLPEMTGKGEPFLLLSLYFASRGFYDPVGSSFFPSFIGWHLFSKNFPAALFPSTTRGRLFSGFPGTGVFSSTR